MQIYPGIHDIISTKTVDKDTDVQLAYITKDTDTPTVSLDVYYSSSKKTQLIPYETFNRQDILLYDENDNLITDSYKYIIRTDNGKYQYIPQNINATIKPDIFNYVVIGKKNESYDSLKNYYISVKAYNDKINSDDADSLVDILKTIFLDSAVRGLSPSSIIFNQNDQNNFIYDTDDNCNFCFIRSDDGMNVDGTDILSITEFYDKNIWIVVDDNNFPTTDNKMSLYNYDGDSYNYKTDLNIYKSINYDGIKLFLANKYREDVDKEIFTFSDTMYSPLLIKEDSVHHRHIIYSPLSLFKNLTVSKINLIIEYIVKIYLRSYIRSNTVYSSWIADGVPDYVVSNYKLTKILKFTSDKPYYDLLEEDKDTVSYIDINILDNDNISAFLDASDYIVFNKIKKNNAVTKPDGYISIYCHNKTIIYYKDNVFTKTTDLNECISYNIDLNTLYVTIQDYYDSYENIAIIKNEISLTIKSGVSSNICIVVKDNKAKLINEDDYIIDDGIVLGILYIQYNKNAEYQLYDIRLRGGGLPKNKTPDFQSILDIGSIKGMSYRKAGSIIIQIPEEFKQYDSIIRNAIEKHKAADEYAIVLYY